jgi:hypothetical protein
VPPTQDYTVNDIADYGRFERIADQFEAEILYSMSPPPLKKGGFLTAGQGPAKAGAFLNWNAGTGLWELAPAGTGADAILAGAADASGLTRNIAIDVYFRGSFKYAPLVAANTDAAAVTAFATAVGGRIVPDYGIVIMP